MSACLWGVVSDADTGAGIEGAVVTIKDANGKTYTATTDEAGIYVISPQTSGGIPAIGTVTAKVDAEGYDDYSNFRGVNYQDGLLGGWPSDKQDFDLTRVWEHIQYDADLQVTAHQITANMGLPCFASDIKNNGPDTIDYSVIELDYSYSQTALADPNQIGFANGSQPVTLTDFTPGKSVHICPFDYVVGYHYVGSFTISGVDINDPVSSNNTVDWEATATGY
jgi:hypothetical protein